MIGVAPASGLSPTKQLSSKPNAPPRIARPDPPADEPGLPEARPLRAPARKARPPRPGSTEGRGQLTPPISPTDAATLPNPRTATISAPPNADLPAAPRAVRPARPGASRAAAPTQASKQGVDGQDPKRRSDPISLAPESLELVEETSLDLPAPTRNPLAAKPDGNAQRSSARQASSDGPLPDDDLPAALGSLGGATQAQGDLPAVVGGSAAGDSLSPLDDNPVSGLPAAVGFGGANNPPERQATEASLSAQPSNDIFEELDLDLSPPGKAGPARAAATSDSPDSLDLPSPAADLDSNLEQELELDAGFGHLDLPLVSASEREPSAPSGLGSAAVAATALGGAGEDDAPSADPFADLPDLDAGFGAGPLSNAPTHRHSAPGQSAAGRLTPQDPIDPVGASDLDEFGGLALGQSDFGAADSLRAPEPGGSTPFGDAPFDAPLSGDSLAPGDRSATRAAGGGTDYGEVSFGGPSAQFDDLTGESAAPPGLDTADDGMEFGAIPQEAQSSGLTDNAHAQATDPTAAAVGAGLATQTNPRASSSSGSSRRKWWLGAGLAAAVTGGALSLLPDVGPFGAYAISDALNASDHASLLDRSVQASVTARSSDDYAKAMQALGPTERAQSSSTRYRPLSAYLAYQQYAVVLRFGSQPKLESQARVRLDTLAREGVDPTTPFLALAKAARLAAEGETDKARSRLRRLAGQQRGDLNILTTLGELELQAGKFDAAKQAWSDAAKLSRSAWTLFGLARSQFADQPAQAKANAEASLELNPQHAGAKAMLAELFWKDKQETKATELLQQIIEPASRASVKQKVLAHTVLGDVHFARGRMSKASGAFTEALKADPKSHRALLGLAETLFQGGRFAAALARYEAAVASEPDSIVAQVGVAKAQIFLEKTDDAQRQLARLAKAHPKSPLIAFWFAKVTEQVGKLELAQKTYESAIAAGGSSPEVVKSYVALSQLLARTQKLDEAGQLLTQAQRELPESATLRKALGDVALSQGRYAKALDEFRKAQALDQDDVGARFKVGSSLRRLGRFEEATAVFDEVAQVDPDLPGLPLERGLLLEQSGRSEEALKQYESALASSPDDLDLKLRVGCGRVIAGNGPGAETILREVQKKRPNSAENNHCIGRALFLQSKNLEALRFLQQAASRDPNRAEYHLHVGWVANAAGQVALAQESLDRALELDQGLADAYWQRGILLLSRGNAVEAVKNLRKALTLKPSRHDAHADLAQAYYQLGKEVKALGEWRSALAVENDRPTWLFRFGKLLHARHHSREAASNLVRAIQLGEQLEPPPTWLWQAHQLAASSLGRTPKALEHWRKFLELGPQDSPYRADAKRALARAGKPWTGN